MSFLAIGSSGRGARVFRLHSEPDTWEKIGKISGNYEFGWSVSLSTNGQRLAIGDPRNSQTGSNKGLVRIYKWLADNASVRDIANCQVYVYVC